MSLAYTMCNYPNFNKIYILINIYHMLTFVYLKSNLHNILCKCNFNNHSLHTINHHMKIQRHKCLNFNQVWSLVYMLYRLFDFSIVNIPCCNSYGLKCILYNCSGHFGIQDIRACTLMPWFLKEHKPQFLNSPHGQIHDRSTEREKQLLIISLSSHFNENRKGWIR